MVEGREYGRLRLDKPTRDAKYLSGKGSGSRWFQCAGRLRSFRKGDCGLWGRVKGAGAL